MARRREFARGAAAIGKARLTTWMQFEPTAITMTAAGGTIAFSLNAAALALRPFTVVRSHFELALRSDQAGAVETQAIGFGIAVVSDEASAVGAAAVPTPVTQAASGLWFVHQFVFSDESSLTDRTRGSTKRSIDSKAMRKVEVGQDIVVVGELGAIGGGAVLSIAGRMLVKNN